MGLLASVQVCRAIRRVDRAFAAHGLARFHAEPRPHVSLLWALGSISEDLQVRIAFPAPLGSHRVV